MLVGTVIASAPAPLLAAEEIAATPYRPSVSNPAALSAPGYFEIEAGLLRARNDDPRRRDSLPVLLKYAFTENVGVLLGGEAYVWQRSDTDGRVNGVGDTNLTLKLHHALTDSLALGLEAGVKLPTARDLIGSGKSDKIINGIVSAELGEFTVDINVGANRLGAVDPGASRTAYTWAGAVSHPLTDAWGITGEFSGVSQRGATSTSQFLAAVSYNVSKKVVLDAGMAWGLTRASIDRSIFGGVTILLK